MHHSSARAPHVRSLHGAFESFERSHPEIYECLLPRLEMAMVGGKRHPIIVDVAPKVSVPSIHHRRGGGRNGAEAGGGGFRLEV